MIPPPTTIIIKIPDAALVYFPSPSTARLKILPHIIDVHNPQTTSKSALKGTTVNENEDPVNTGIDVVTVFGVSMAAIINIIASPDTVESITLLDTLPPTSPPMKRPTSIRNQ